MSIQICPVCGCRHEIHAILERLSYGRARTCSPRCKAVFPALARARALGDFRLVAEIEEVYRLRKAA